MKVKTLFVYVFCQTNHNLGTKNELMFSFLSKNISVFIEKTNNSLIRESIDSVLGHE